MRAVVTRVSSASVTIDGAVHGQIGAGYLVLLGVGPQDTPAQVVKLADKICNLRVFSDEAGKMNLNLAAVNGSLLVISQFTLYADLKSRRARLFPCRQARFGHPAVPAVPGECEARGFHVEHGEFGADMQVASVNDGPVTLLFDTDTL